MRRSCRAAINIPAIATTKPSTPKLIVTLSDSVFSLLTIASFAEEAMAVFETFMYDVGVTVDVFVFMAGVADDGFDKSSRMGLDLCPRVRLREETQNEMEWMFTSDQSELG